MANIKYINSFVGDPYSRGGNKNPFIETCFGPENCQAEILLRGRVERHELVEKTLCEECPVIKGRGGERRG